MTESTLQLNVEIQSPDFLTFINQHGFKLCIGQQINDQYNVSWVVIGLLSPTTTIAWPRTFGIFSLDDYAVGAVIKDPENAVSIAPGQRIELTPEGQFGVPGPQSTAPHSIIVDKLYAPTHLALGVALGAACQPMFAQQQTGTGQVILTPAPKLSIWFQQDIEQGTIIGRPPVTAFETDLAGVSSATVTNTNGKWSRSG